MSSYAGFKAVSESNRSLNANDFYMVRSFERRTNNFYLIEQTKPYRKRYFMQ